MEENTIPGLTGEGGAALPPAPGNSEAGEPAAAQTGEGQGDRHPGGAAFRAHFQELARQALALRQTAPDFDLAKELQDPAFVRLTSPGSGVSLAQAYYALHRDSLQQQAMEAAAARTALRLADAIRSGSLRPAENGAAQSPTVQGFDYRSATPEQREALKQRIRQAALRGEVIYPGM